MEWTLQAQFKWLNKKMKQKIFVLHENAFNIIKNIYQ